MSVIVGGAGSAEAARYRLGLLFVTLSAIGWSTSGYFTRLIPLDAWTITFWRGAFGALTGVIFIASQEGAGTWRAFRSINRHGLLFCLSSAGAMICFINALSLTSVAQVAVIYAIVPFVAASLAWIVMRERAPLVTLVASGIAVVGVIVATMSGHGEGGFAGDCLAAVMTLFVGGMIVVGRIGGSVPLLPAACLSTLLSALIALPFASPLAANATELLQLALFGFCNMGIGLALFVMGAKLIPAAQTALIGSLELPLAAFWVWVTFGETPTTGTMIGGAIVMVAVIGNTLRDVFVSAG